MKLPIRMGLALALAAGGVGAGAQLLPPLPVPDVTGTLERTVSELGRIEPRALARVRLDRLRDLVRSAAQDLELLDDGPAVRGQVLVIGPDPVTLAAVQAAGFTLSGRERIEALDTETVILSVPAGWSVERALSRLRRIAPGGEFAANHIHYQSGVGAVTAGAALAQGAPPGGHAIGIIDSGVADHPSLPGAIEQRGFAAGAPRPSAHGTALASLIAGRGPVRGAAPGAPLIVADIYGSDPRGGNAVALARALGLMAQRHVPVVAISLVGPYNPLVARAVAQAQARGMHIVAAVGNDGPAAPPAFPASYPGVIAVTGVDGRNRLLPEAGRAAHLDYAAPGADMGAAAAGGGVGPVRGTSYAVPLVAGRLYRHARRPGAIARLDGEATERGRRGFGRGLVCGTCRTPVPRR